MMKTNIILNGDALTHLREMPDKKINMVITSPPYWALRDYGSEVEIIWDGDKDCEHDWEISDSMKINKMVRLRERIEKEKWNVNSKFVKGWIRPSREEFNKRKIMNICPVCEKEFEGKPTQKFCSKKCLNTLSNEKRQSIEQNSNFCLKCGAWKGQLGLEPTFDLYIKHLCDIFDEVKRVLRDDGTIWVNLGDTYYSVSGGKFMNDNIGSKDRNELKGLAKANELKSGKELEQKNLTLVPLRFAIEMQNRGWIIRNVIIWHKPNCMPSSVKDRFTVDFEYLFFFSKKKKYYFETQYESYVPDSLRKTKRNKNNPKGMNRQGLDSWKPQLSERQQSLINKIYKIKKDIRDENISYKGKSKDLSQYNNALANAKAYRSGLKILQEQEQLTSEELNFLKDYTQNHFSNPLGRNKRTVWSICPKPFSEAHFAVYPPELCEIPISAGCPEFVCIKCGNPKVKSYNKIGEKKVPPIGGIKQLANMNPTYSGKTTQNIYDNGKHKPTCQCNAGFTSGIVLDPFFGSGTT